MVMVNHFYKRKENDHERHEFFNREGTEATEKFKNKIFFESGFAFLKLHQKFYSAMAILCLCALCVLPVNILAVLQGSWLYLDSVDFSEEGIIVPPKPDGGQSDHFLIIVGVPISDAFFKELFILLGKFPRSTNPFFRSHVDPRLIVGVGSLFGGIGKKGVVLG
jgi:hypothetical protein